MKKTFKIEILGREYFLKSDENDEVIEQIKDYINGRIKEISENVTKNISSTNVLVLLALNIASDFIKEKNKTELQKKFIVNKSRKALETIDQVLMKHTSSHV